MGKKKNLSEGCTKEELDFIDEKMMRRLNGDELSNMLRTLSYKLDIKCKNKKQKEFLKLIKEKEITFCSGSAGTGKSYISLSVALELLKGDNSYEKIIIVVPTVQSDLEIGFLKGDLEQKLQPFAEAHMYTIEKILNASGNNGKFIMGNLIKNGFIEFKCVSFMRGSTIDNAILICTESQQFPKSAFKTILTRIGENSKYIFEGDIEQIDNKELKKQNTECGLKYAIDKLKDVDKVGTIEFTREDTVRNPIILEILNKWDE